MSEQELWAEIRNLKHTVQELHGERRYMESVNRDIFAMYETNTASAMTNNDYTLIDYEDKVVDTHNCVTVGAAWKYTCLKTGYYDCSASMALATNVGWTVGETAQVHLYKNGANNRLLGRSVAFDNGGGASVIMGASGSGTVYCVPGDYLQFYCFQNSGGNINLLATAITCWCSIWCRN